MNKNLVSLFLLLLLAALIGVAALPSAVAAAPSADVRAQLTPAVTIIPPGATLVPPAGTAIVVVPVTGGPDTSTLLFYGILILAGLAFVIMLFALMRRPSEPHDHHDHEI